jgi:hypothetical protein
MAYPRFGLIVALVVLPHVAFAEPPAAHPAPAAATPPATHGAPTPTPHTAAPAPVAPAAPAAPRPVSPTVVHPTIPTTLHVAGPPAAPGPASAHHGPPSAGTPKELPVHAQPAAPEPTHVIVAGYVTHSGPQPPKEGSWLNRASVEFSVASRGKRIEQAKEQLGQMESELSRAKVDAARTSGTSARTRARVSEGSAFTTNARGETILDRGKESAYHAAGQEEYKANEHVRSLEKSVGELRQSIDRDTKSYDTARADLAAHPEASWFKM